MFLIEGVLSALLISLSPQQSMFLKGQILSLKAKHLSYKNVEPKCTKSKTKCHFLLIINLQVLRDAGEDIASWYLAL